MAQIKFVFPLGGDVKLVPTGFEGPACHKATEPYERALEGSKTVQASEAGVSLTQGQTQQQRIG